MAGTANQTKGKPAPITGGSKPKAMDKPPAGSRPGGTPASRAKPKKK
jgi:hypothetical protein